MFLFNCLFSDPSKPPPPSTIPSDLSSEWEVIKFWECEAKQEYSEILGRVTECLRSLSGIISVQGVKSIGWRTGVCLENFSLRCTHERDAMSTEYIAEQGWGDPFFKGVYHFLSQLASKEKLRFDNSFEPGLHLSSSFFEKSKVLIKVECLKRIVENVHKNIASEVEVDTVFVLDYDRCMAEYGQDNGKSNADDVLVEKNMILKAIDTFVSQDAPSVDELSSVRFIIVDDMEKGDFLVNKLMAKAMEELSKVYPSFIFDIVRYDPCSMLKKFVAKTTVVPILYWVSTIKAGDSKHNQAAYQLAGLEAELNENYQELKRLRKKLFLLESSSASLASSI